MSGHPWFTPAAPNPTADRVGRTLLALCSLATLVPLVDGLLRVNAAPAEWALTDFWRTTAYIVFAGLWAILAIAPRAQWGLWELLLAQKTLVTVHALMFLGLPGAVMTAWIDGTLVVLTVAAWVLCRGWQTYQPSTSAGTILSSGGSATPNVRA